MNLVKTTVPRQLGEFQLEEKIGEGGICEVYRSFQSSLDRQVAVKVLRQHYLTNRGLRRRFVREAKILAKLSHPNIIHVIDAGEEDDWVYYVMEFVEGIDYRKILHETTMPLADKLEIITQALKGLEYAHDNHVVHRDLKPANIMVDKSGNARLTDFGIAHLFSDAADFEATKTSELMGTPAYMSPEQQVSAKNIDVRSDIFSMGVILYETVTGRKPVGRVRSPSKLNPDAPPILDEIILTCLEQDPADRYQSAAQLRNQLFGVVSCLPAGSSQHEPAFAGVDNFIGRCKFLDTLNDSPSSVTYLVENTGDRKLYVIKKITGREIELGYLRRLAILKHPHILSVHGAGSDLKKTVVVTDYARGGSVADRLTRRWSEEEGSRFLYEAASALDFAHKNGIVHGNLRPSNVLFDEGGQVLLADFGLPWVVTKRRPWWRAPEAQTSPEADLFSLGAMAYRMLFGDRPRWFSEDNLHFPKVRHFVSRDIRRILCRLLHQNPEKRCSSAEEIVLQLRPRSPARREATVGLEKRKMSLPWWGWVVISIAAITLGTVLALWKGQ